MKKMLLISAIVMVTPAVILCAKQQSPGRQRPYLHVVTTLPDYGFFVKFIGGDRVSVRSIVRGDQDAHFIRPKPSFATAMRDADVLVATGLDLELWLQTIIDNSGNGTIRSGQKGYVSAATGINLLEKPETISRAEGGVHIYGNPHITCSPINMKVCASNIATGLIKNDPTGKQLYEENLKKLHDELDSRLFGEELVGLLGGETLCRLAEKQTLIEFLQQNKYQGKPLIDRLGGWMKKMLPLRGTLIVTYHKNWIYFLKLFGLEEAGTVEPKPGIPPSLKHVTNLVTMMKERKIGIILAANYFDQQKVRTVADRTGAKAVIVPVYVGGAPGTEDYFQLLDYWTDELLKAAEGK
jgi:zinc/manganese transport system substrate-binding protein